MSPDQEAHLQRIKDGFTRDVDAKYRRGQLEHGGDLHRKPGMMRMLREEVLDQVVYQATLEEQIRHVTRQLSAAVSEQDWDLVNRAVDDLLALCDGSTD